MKLDKKLYELHADMCKSLSHSKRIKIIYLLEDGEKHVDELAREIGASKANVSQHLALLREKGVVCTRKEGLNVYYKLCDSKVVKACELMKEVLLERLSEEMNLSKEILSEENK
ncbi:MAG: ArsR/SmtB family transcription factor [Bacillota bacterium]